ncbi:MAG TPA: META domain-containing protein [Vicinamibacteria bacterium]|nr:META domain-containing protein [Vicinamibacteria bacterium]
MDTAFRISTLVLIATWLPCAVAKGTPQESEPPAAVSKSPLVDITWRLLEIQSMDDAIGTVRPDDPSAYTMQLNRDGTFNMRLDCNRATGTWTAEPSQDGSSGRFELGPLAMTRALCPPPRLDERVAKDAPFIRSFLLKDGRLYLSLMADGGIYAWEPLADIAFQTEPDPALETAILAASPDYTREMVDLGGGALARYLHSRLDVNGDGRDELFVYLLGSIFCGTGGCNLLLFTETSDGLSLINNFPISRTPVIVASEKSEGWCDLIRPESGGGAPPSYVRHVFNGTEYVERERMPAEPSPSGTRVLAGEFTFQDGIPLEPRN